MLRPQKSHTCPRAQVRGTRVLAWGRPRLPEQMPLPLQHDRPTEPLLKNDCHTTTLTAIHNVRLLKGLTRNWHFAPVVWSRFVDETVILLWLWHIVFRQSKKLYYQWLFHLKTLQNCFASSCALAFTRYNSNLSPISCGSQRASNFQDNLMRLFACQKRFSKRKRLWSWFTSVFCKLHLLPDQQGKSTISMQDETR